MMVIKVTNTGHDWTYRLQPEPIQVCFTLLFGQSYQPAATSSIPVVLPHGLNPILYPNKKGQSSQH